MFIYSVRASTVKFLAFIFLTVVALVGVIAVSADDTVLVFGRENVKYTGMETNEDRVGFINSFGIAVDQQPKEELSFTVPDDFDLVINGYNQLQKMQGLDLERYAGKKITRYTYTVTNYDYEGSVFANLFIYRGNIIACDLSGGDAEGFVVPLTRVDKAKLK
jgi:hypothetical protein